MRPSNSLLMSNVSASDDANSNVAWAYDIVRCSFQLSVTGTADGNLQVQVSNDQAFGLPPNLFQPVNWSNLGMTVAVSSTSSITVLIPEIEMSYEYVRVVFTDSSSGSSTGTMLLRMKAMAL